METIAHRHRSMDATARGEAAALSAEEPWPGLAAFRERDAPYFAARTAERDELADRAILHRLTVLYGLSGLGKTSLLEAAVFPALRERFCLPVRVRLAFDPKAPLLEAQVFAALAKAADEHCADLPPQRAGETLWEHFHRTSNQYWSPRNRLLMPVLVLDQFEEIFTHGTARRPQEVNGFFESLAALAEGRPPPEVKARLDQSPPDAAREFDFGRHGCHVLLALREEYLAQLDDRRSLIPSLTHNRMRLRPFNGMQAQEAVRKPGGRLVTEAVVKEIVAAVAGERQRVLVPSEQEIDPALLSLLCRELNKRRIDDKRAQIAAEYVTAEERDKILAEFYETGTSAVSRQTRKWIEERLLLPSGRQRDSVAIEAARDAGVAEDEIGSLIAERVIRREEHGGVVRIELTHDVLTDVVCRSRDARRLREKLEAATREELARREAEEGRRRLELEEAARQEKQRIEEAAREQIRRAKEQRNRAVFLIILVVLASAAALSILISRGARDRAIAGNLASLALLLADPAFQAPPDAGPLLAAAAYRMRPDTAARRSLLKMQNQFARVSAVLRPLPLREGQLHAAPTSVAFSPDRKLIVAGAEDGTLTLWDAADLRSHYRVAAGEMLKADARRVTSVAFSPDGTTVLSRHADGTIVVRDSAKRELLGKPLATSANDAVIVAFDRDNTILMPRPSGEDKKANTALGSVVVWDVPAGTRLNPALGGVGPVLAMSLDGRRIASTGTDGSSLAIQEVATGTRVGEELRRTDQNEQIAGLAFSPDGRRIVAVSADGEQVVVWDVGQSRQLARLVHGPAHGSLSVAFSPGGETIASGSGDGTIAFWDAASGARIGEPLRKHKDAIVALAYSPDGKTIASASKDGTLILWTTAESSPLGERLTAHDSPVQAVAFSPDGRTIVSASEDGKLAFWDADARRRLAEPPPIHSLVECLVFSGDGKRVASGGSGGEARREGMLVLWDANTREPIGDPLRVGSVVLSAGISPDGRLIATGAEDGTLVLWDVVKREQLGEPLRRNEKDGGLRSLAFSPDGRTIATGTFNGNVILWDVATRKARDFGRRHEGVVNSLAFSRDGKHIVSAGGDRKVLVLDAVDGKQIGQPLSGHKDAVRSIALTMEGRTIVSGDRNGTLMLWDADSREPLGERIRGHLPGEGLLSIAASRDGSRLVSGGDRGTLVLWDADPKSWLEKLCRKLPPDLSRVAWSKYAGIDVPLKRQCDGSSERSSAR
jgi:WD40 repeat protein